MSGEHEPYRALKCPQQCTPGLNECLGHRLVLSNPPIKFLGEAEGGLHADRNQWSHDASMPGLSEQRRKGRR
jgi:hypothetical protein